MFRLVIVVLAAVGLGSLLFGTGGGLALGAGWLLLAPLLFVFKIMFLVMIIGMIGGALRGNRRPVGRGPWGWRPMPEREIDRGPSRREQFEEWHRMEHARREVDSWVEDDV